MCSADGVVPLIRLRFRVEGKDERTRLRMNNTSFHPMGGGEREGVEVRVRVEPEKRNAHILDRDDIHDLVGVAEIEEGKREVCVRMMYSVWI